MIHYDLRCDDDHSFDGWFKDSASFEAQAAGGLLECPLCGGKQVTRALMAPALPRRRKNENLPVPSKPAPTSSPAVPAQPQVPVSGGNIPDHLRAMLQKLRAEVEKNCDYVGPSFADEARKIHRGEVDPRGIYGETSPEQAEALVEEGIEIARIPWLPRADG